uniref:Uncharacterized protein n=1 Tax=Pipistrellus kuhlii TaxID=59472 RepID=A0A7J8B224_PIPKU|nr:hypothetical protein mPipKuh1_007770 [Pipistrellus kuhlii]
MSFRGLLPFLSQLPFIPFSPNSCGRDCAFWALLGVFLSSNWAGCVELETALSESEPSFQAALTDPTGLELPPPTALPCDLGQPGSFLSHTQDGSRCWSQESRSLRDQRLWAAVTFHDPRQTLPFLSLILLM